MRVDSLAGVRVIDLATGIPGPVAAMIFAEVGADVIKVEPPEGDPQRGTPGFMVWNRSKKSVVLDIRAQKVDLDRLLAGADVLFHSYTQAEAAELGLDDASLGERHPHLIVSGITGWPQGLSKQALPARDSLVLAEAGIMDEQLAVRREGPIYLRLPLGSWFAASLAAIGVLARLIHRDRGGRPGPAHTSLLQGAMVTMNMHWVRSETPSEAMTRGLPKDIMASLFQCSDGMWLHIMMAVDHTPMVQAEFERLGPDWVAKADADVADGYWVSFPHFGAVREVLKTRPHDEWLAHFREHDVPVQPALRMGEIYFDEQAQLNNYVVDVNDPQFGATKQPGVPFTLDPAPRVRWGCRPLGVDTQSVLAESAPPRPAPVPQRNAARPPLAGVKVLDLGAALAGPLGPMLMGDLGAEVIKLEPTQGDMLRPIAASFVGCQRGKRAMAVSLKNPAAREIIARLVHWADVVHHNLRMPAARKLGIDYETLRAIKPDIVYCHTSSYGPVGPRKDWPGMDQMFQSSCGWELAGAGRDNPPIWHRFGFTDHLCAMASAQAVLLALRQRDQTGEGQFVTASLLGATILTASETIVLPNGHVTPFAEIDPMQLGLTTFERIYSTRDGWVLVSEPDAGRQQAMLSALGATDEAGCESVFASTTQAGALQRLRAAGVTCAPVRRAQKDAFLDSAENRDARLRVAYPHGDYGFFEQLGAFWNFGDLPLKLDRAPPALGEHTIELMREFGYAEIEIQALIESKTIFAVPSV